MRSTASARRSAGRSAKSFPAPTQPRKRSRMSGTSSSGPETWTDLFLRSLGAHETSRAPAGRVDGVPSIPRYEVRERLGEGATAVVYKAWDRELKRVIALKVLRGKAAMSPVMRERF